MGLQEQRTRRERSPTKRKKRQLRPRKKGSRKAWTTERQVVTESGGDTGHSREPGAEVKAPCKRNSGKYPGVRQARMSEDPAREEKGGGGEKADGRKWGSGDAYTRDIRQAPATGVTNL